MKKSNVRHNLKRLITLFLVMICVTTSIILAYEIDLTCLEPEENQYFELRGVEVKKIEGKNRQVIMELWGYNIEFKRI